MKYPEGITEISPGQRGTRPSWVTPPQKIFPLPSLPRRNPMKAGDGERGFNPHSARVALSAPSPQLGYGEANNGESTCSIALHPRTPAASPGMNWPLVHTL